MRFRAGKTDIPSDCEVAGVEPAVLVDVVEFQALQIIALADAAFGKTPRGTVIVKRNNEALIALDPPSRRAVTGRLTGDLSLVDC